MQIVDRYLNEVKRYLPAAQRDDIAKELSANILAEMDDRESALGRPLSEDEQIAILQQQGSPMLVASRYRHDQRAFSFGRVIIGPALFSLYTKILALNLCITVVVTSVVITALGVHGGLSALLWPALIQFAVITTIFAALEQSQKKSHILDRWNPRALPPRHDPLKISRFNSFSGMLSGVIFVLCWLHVPGATYAVIYLFLGPLVNYIAPTSVSPVFLSPSWQLFYLPILLLVLMDIAQHGLNFAFPRWTRNRLFIRAALSSLSLIVVLLLFRAGDLLLLNPDLPAATGNPGLAPLLAIVNLSVHYTMLVAAAIKAFGIFRQVTLAIHPPYLHLGPPPSLAARPPQI
jgi:hypothetical protein